MFAYAGAAAELVGCVDEKEDASESESYYSMDDKQAPDGPPMKIMKNIMKQEQLGGPPMNIMKQDQQGGPPMNIMEKLAAKKVCINLETTMI